MPTPAEAPDPDEIGVQIDGKEYRGFTDIEVTRSLDSYSTAEFSAPFEADRAEFRETFRPFSFKPLTVTIGGAPLFTGRLVDVKPNVTPASRTVSVTAYALPGTIEDCTAPASKLPLEFRKLKLGAIAKALVEPFGIEVDVDGDDGAAFDKVALETDKKIQELLADLARQRGMVMTSTPEGWMLFWRSADIGRPVVRLTDHERPVMSVAATFSPQDYFSEITGFAKATRRKKGAKYTAQNPWLADVLRPLCFHLDDAETAEARTATLAKLGRMFANATAYSVDVATWRDPADQLWEPNTTVTLNAPDVMVYRETELLVRTVTMRRTPAAKTATLGLVLPGSFTTDQILTPERLPWDE